jgi:DNA-binding MarR family transcriptional regulator
MSEAYVGVRVIEWRRPISLAKLTNVTAAINTSVAELSALLRPALLRLTRLVRNQRVDLSVTLTQLSAMGSLTQHGPMSAGELAACERVQPPSMTKVLANLEERGLVRREPHPEDRRQAIIAITDAGNDLLESERRSRDAWLTRRVGELTGEERALLRAVIPVLDKLAEQ